MQEGDVLSEKKKANKQVVRTAGANRNLSKVASHRFSRIIAIIAIIAIAVSLILTLLEKIGFFFASDADQALSVIIMFLNKLHLQQ